MNPNREGGENTIRTKRTIIGIALGVFALTILVGGAGFGADGKSVTITTVTPAVTTAPVAQPKFENFDPAKYTGETGKIVIPFGGDEAVIALRKVVDGKLGNHLVGSGKGKSVIVPVGAYKVTNIEASVVGKSGQTWWIIRNQERE